MHTLNKIKPACPYTAIETAIEKGGIAAAASVIQSLLETRCKTTAAHQLNDLAGYAVSCGKRLARARKCARLAQEAEALAKALHLARCTDYAVTKGRVLGTKNPKYQ
jgi:hypothetical protein